MALACPAPDPSASLVQGLAAYLQCHAGVIGELGYQTFSGSSMLAALLTSCLTIYVALFGYRLLLRQDIDLQDLIVAVVRIGAVFTFALHWGAYQPVVYRVVVDGPAELANMVLQPEGLAVTTASETASRLEGAYEALEQAPFGVTPNAVGAPPPLGGLVPPPSAVVMPPSGVAPSGAKDFKPAMTPGGILLMTSALGPLAALQMATAVLLALGPVVIVLALFDPFLGLLEGWMRAFGGALLGGCGLAIVLALELNFLEAEVASAATAPHTDPDVFAVAAVFGILGVGVLVAAGLVALGLRIPRLTRNAPRFATRGPPAIASSPLSTTPRPAAERGLAPSRAQAVADAVVMRSQRQPSFVTAEMGLNRTGALSGSVARAETIQRLLQPLGSSLRSPNVSRRSLNIARRNGR